MKQESATQPTEIAETGWRNGTRGRSTLADDLDRRLGHLPTAELLDAIINEEFPNEVAVISSFGTEAAVLLHLIARINPDVKVLFVDTGKLFGETRRYRAKLVDLLGLTNVQVVAPGERTVMKRDPKDDLWSRNADACCRLRKVEPLEEVLNGFQTWITGRKRFQGEKRTALKLFEQVAGKIRMNPLRDWTRSDISTYFAITGLPKHPLVSEGYLSVGCMPCTSPIRHGEDFRSGRWRGKSKTECGIHLPGGRRQ